MKRIKKWLLSILVLFGMLLPFTGCELVDGCTLYLDNSTSYYMTVTWQGRDYGVGGYGYNSHSVPSGSGTATCYASGYGYWGSEYVSLSPGESTTLYMYWSKNAEGKKEIKISKTKPLESQKIKE